jgi:outer membrane protein OmpA-like peptidoglycan-associated protein
MTSAQPIDVLQSSLQRLLDVMEESPLDGRTVNSTAMLIGFDVDSPALTDEHKSQLDDIVEFLLARPEACVTSIAGHASQTGAEANNRALAFNRAETVNAYLSVRGIESSRIGPTVSSGSRQPLVNMPGREAESNRSVELCLEWRAAMARPLPLTPTSTASTDWELDLVLSVAASGKLPVSPAGQFQLGELKRLDASGNVLAKKRAYMFVAGVDIDFTPKKFKDLPVSFTAGAGKGGEIYMPTPPGAVDFDWFDGRCVVLIGTSIAMGAGTEGTMVAFPRLGEWPGTFYAQVTTGFQAGASVVALIGVLNIED